MLSSKKNLPLILFPLFLNCVACASLEIEVDVYKGPLINNENVQLEETVMVAIASKPLFEMVRHELKSFSSDSFQFLVSHLEKILCMNYQKCLQRNDQVNFVEPSAEQAKATSLEQALQIYLKNPGEVQKNILLGHLTRFAAELRVLGNFSILAMGEEIAYQGSGTELGGRAEGLKYFVRVLQGVGNSILFQIDSIRGSDDWKQKRLEEAAREKGIIETTTYRENLAWLKNEGASTSRIDILDAVITALEYKYIAAIEDSSVDDKTKKSLKDSLAEAYRYRASLAFLQSSTAFLRTSYPATTLQEKKTEGGLNNFFYRGFKKMFFPGIDHREPTKAYLADELDKQYWQNINQIRLVAGGDTNYAVVKDDVGNWYIKGYSTNPKEILDSINKIPIGALIKGGSIP